MDALMMLITCIILAVVTWTLTKLLPRYRAYIKIFSSDKFLSIGKFHPIWGHLHLLKDFSDYGRLVNEGVQKTGKRITGIWIMFFFPLISVCHPDTVKLLLKSTLPKPKQFGGGYFSVIPWVGDGLLMSDGKKWERNRKLLTPAFHFDVLKPYVSIYNKVFDIYLDKLEKGCTNGESVEVYEAAGLATLDTMLQCSLSYDGRVQEQGSSHSYVNAVRRLTYIAIDRCIKPWQFPDILFELSPAGREFYKHTKYIHDFDERVIKERRKSLVSNPNTDIKRRLDFVDILLSAKDEDGKGLTDREIRDEVDTFLFAGHDTTSSALSWAIYALSLYQDEQQKVFEEVRKIVGNKSLVEWSDIQNFSVITHFLRESMRMFTTVPEISRYTTHDIEIDGLIIPKHTEISILISVLNKREDVWTDPEVFRPERFLNESGRDPFSFVPFSAGPRNCIGQHFALNELKVAIAKLVQRFKVLPDPDHTPIECFDAVLRSKDGIWVKLERR